MNPLQGKYATAIVLFIAIAFLLGSLVIIYIPILEHTGGIIAYPLDDAYIHMAISKNLILNHVWGISPHEFSSSSSSVIYPLLLAGLFGIFGIHVGVPLFFNAVIGVIFLIVLQRWLARQGLSPGKQLMTLLIVTFLIPLPPLIQCGMEHTLQLLFYFLFVYSFADALEEKDKRFPWKVYLYGFVLTAIRYESLAVIAIACVLLLFYKKLRPAILLGAISFLPVLVFGLYAMSKGSDFMPNSVSLKSGLPPLTFDGLFGYFTGPFGARLFFTEGGYNMAGTQRLLLLLPLIYLLFLKQVSQRPAYRYVLIILMLASLAHVSLMMYAGAPRYEAALVGNCVIICTLLIIKYTRWDSQQPLSGAEWMKILVGCVVAAPLFLRGWNGFERSSLAAISIYDQQVQMGHFVHDYYDTDAVAFNDIGAVSYFAHGNNLDLWGLGDVEVARSRKNHYDSPAFLDSLSHRRQVKIAIVFNYAFQGLVQRWTKVASWTIPYNNASADASVFFYAVDPAEAPRLATSLKNYQPGLPKGVIVNYY